MEDMTLILDATGLTRDHVATVNTIALLAKESGAKVLALECQPKDMSYASSTRILRMGLLVDDFHPVYESDRRHFSQRMIVAIRDIVASGEPVFVLTGDIYVLKYLKRLGIKGVFYNV